MNTKQENIPVNIRVAGKEEAVLLAAIKSQNAGKETDGQDIQGVVEDKAYSVYVAEICDSETCQIAGFVQMKHSNGGEIKKANIDFIIVAEEFWNYGVGSKLLKGAIEKTLEEQGSTTFTAEIPRNDNEKGSAEALFRHCGFKAVTQGPESPMIKLTSVSFLEEDPQEEKAHAINGKTRAFKIA